jgi:thiol-disulfide isomerase/thioredoxin
VKSIGLTAKLRNMRPVLLLVLGGVLAFGSTGRAQKTAPPAKPAAADPAVIELRDYQKLLETHRGKPLLVNFWATWCEPCRDEYPMMVELSKTYGPQGLTIIAISLDEDVDINLVRRFLAKMNPTFSNYRKKPGKDQDFINGVSPKWSGVLPATFFYDREGRLAASFVGEHKQPEFESQIQQLLRSLAPAAGANRNSAP